jgi:hypothetical protein
MKIKKLELVKNIETNEKNAPIAFQLVEIVLSYYGNEQKFELDTKIMKNGDQIIIDGNGFIPAGTNLNTFIAV